MTSESPTPTTETANTGAVLLCFHGDNLIEKLVDDFRDKGVEAHGLRLDNDLSDDTKLVNELTQHTRDAGEAYIVVGIGHDIKADEGWYNRLTHLIHHASPTSSIVSGNANCIYQHVDEVLDNFT